MKSEDEIFALNPEFVQVDDIVLTSGDGVIPFGIRMFTSSDLSHVALCTRPGMLFEAVMGGVLRRSIIGTFAVRAEWIKVLRPKTPLPPNSSGLRVANYAECMYGRAYSVFGAIASRFGTFSAADNGSVFCSHVVAQAFAEYGVDLLPGKQPSKIFPSMFLESSMLTDVSDICIRRLGSISNADLYKEVIATAEIDLPGDEMQMNRRVFDVIKSMLGQKLPQNIFSLSDLWDWLSEGSDAAKEADSIIFDILQSEGFVAWYADWNVDVQSQTNFISSAANLIEIASHEQMTPEISSAIQDFAEILPLSKASLDGRRSTLEKYERLSQTTGLKTIQYFHQKYRNEYESFERLFVEKSRLHSALKGIGQNKP